ncbi:hypothetical protein NXS19_008352 [Fusarium pseudograminearum]|nr:hypothetical protein NXS19_008352 [Fusarium pseudograminearum]
MDRTQTFKQAIRGPNHRRARPIFFRNIEISLDDICYHQRKDLKKSDSFRNINKALKGTANSLLAKIYHFGYTAFLMSSIAHYSGKKKEAQERITTLKDNIKDDIEYNRPSEEEKELLYNIQGFTCRSPVNLWLYLDDERQQFSGPTEGKIKINPRRISKYKIVRR